LNNSYFKIFLLAFILILNGIFSAYNSKWMRDGISPLWTSYITSFISATIYAYTLKSNLFSLTYTSVFQVFFFHASWYLTTILWIGEVLSTHRLIGLFLVFIGMILMSFK
jgi:hypothetical protein